MVNVKFDRIDKLCCSGCGESINSFEVIDRGLAGDCGACERVRQGKAVQLGRGELRRFVRLVEQYVERYRGGARSLLLGAEWGLQRVDPKRRPVLIVVPHEDDQEDPRKVQACEERRQLADLYDRLQHIRGDARRALRI